MYAKVLECINYCAGMTSWKCNKWDLIQKVSKMCPNQPVPSEQWVLNIQCKNDYTKKAVFHLPDGHYCAAIFSTRESML